MSAQDAIPWPPGYRLAAAAVAALGLGFALFSALLGALWLGWAGALPMIAMGGIGLVGGVVGWRGLGARPMISVQDGRLLARLASSRSRKSANLLHVAAFALDEIEYVEREIRPWPNGERHVYRLHLRDGGERELLPRSADPALRASLAAFFERHFPGRIRESRLG